ncbi:hypothetical protein VSH64_46175 [Amycolatopsis rhabdoformis]|uniref:Uncharacterized protein n=1 Tax=Amycolatopsis rhabdoformis TaxID=1448059 RepID=A0ABZ1I6Y4_9PSEU|nr:hypothetical protein [Amycolatopsis rhabdoformis]WSE30102.1 hypothetical protein VSH64_46175 [Amycolatopsis rhabdoformis]
MSSLRGRTALVTGAGRVLPVDLGEPEQVTALLHQLGQSTSSSSSSTRPTSG